MLTADTLRQLADLAAPERAFLTVYLDHGDDAEALEPRFERIRALLATQPAEREHFEESLALARGLLESERAPEGGALAVFASWAADLDRAFALPAPVGTMAWMGDAPFVRPVYELLDEHETFAVAVVDSTRARVFLVTAGESEQESSVRGDVKNKVKKGGWSQKRYARRRDKEMEGYATEVAEALVALSEEKPFTRLVLLGADEAVQAVRDALRTDLIERLVATDSVATDAAEVELIAQATAFAEDAERLAERELWDEIREQGLTGALSAFGPTRVLTALQSARAEAVLLDREADLAGTKCRACETVVHGTPSTCQACGSSDVFRLDLGEHLTEQAARTGATVDFADPFDALTEAGGVAALLRY